MATGRDVPRLSAGQARQSPGGRRPYCAELSGVSLVTRDQDFRAFAERTKLGLETEGA